MILRVFRWFKENPLALLPVYFVLGAIWWAFRP